MDKRMGNIGMTFIDDLARLAGTFNNRVDGTMVSIRKDFQEDMLDPAGRLDREIARLIGEGCHAVEFVNFKSKNPYRLVEEGDVGESMEDASADRADEREGLNIDDLIALEFIESLKLT